MYFSSLRLRHISITTIVNQAMFSSLGDFATLLITNLGYSGVFIGMALVAICIPVPSEITLGLAGYFIYKGELNFVLVLLAAALGNAAGSTLLYSLTRYKGSEFLAKYGKCIFLKPSRVRKAESWVTKYGNISVFAAQLLPAIGSIISIPAGTLKMRYLDFIIYTILGGLIWASIFIYTGYVLGENWWRISEFVVQFRNVFLFIAIPLVVLFGAAKLYRDTKHH